MKPTDPKPCKRCQQPISRGDLLLRPRARYCLRCSDEKRKEHSEARRQPQLKAETAG